MVIVRSPLRITLGGGGTDKPSYVRDHGGFALTAAIDSYIYVSVIKPFRPGIYLKYSQHEQVDHPECVVHPIFREVLKQRGCTQIEISTLAEIPAGTGLGSSSSFTTALLKAMSVFHREMISTEELAQQACEIEIGRLCAPIGKQDQYAAAYGGICALTFEQDGRVCVDPIAMSDANIATLEDGLLLFYTGQTRETNMVLERRVATADELTKTKELGWRSRDALCAGKLRTFGQLLHTHWCDKQVRGLSTPEADHWYAEAVEHGAIGGKLVGAGGGGFLLFYTEQPRELRRGMTELGLPEVRFRFDFDGTRVL